jgi:hypothetical protein
MPVAGTVQSSEERSKAEQRPGTTQGTRGPSPRGDGH